MCRLKSVRIFVTITVEYDLDMDHMDVSTAFLYAVIQEKVFVEQAPGFEVKDGGELVMQLEKSLYGLAQSPENWFYTIALRFFYVRELVSEGRISINYISTDNNPADIVTKHLNKHRFKHLLDLISNFDVNNIKK